MTQPQPQQGVAYAPPDDEISLVELWQILVKRKRVFFAVFVVCLLLGIAYAFLKPAVYETRIALRIGQTNGELLESGENLSSRLMAQYGEQIADGVKREPPFLQSAAPKKDAPATVTLVAEGGSPSPATDLLTRVVSETRKHHDRIFDENTTLLTERVSALGDQVASLEKQYNEATRLLGKLEERAPVQASLLMIERGQLSATMRTLDQERFAVSRQLTPPQTQRTDAIGEIVAPESPSAPKRTLVVIMSAVIGLLGGAMVAFAANYFRRNTSV